MPDTSEDFTLEGVLSLNPGTFNRNVQQMQNRLNALGYCGAGQKPLVADGKFGSNSLYAVHAFKKNNKLGNTGASEGKIGPQSWKVLFSPDAITASGEKAGTGTSDFSMKKPVYYSQEDSRWKSQLYSNHRDPGQTIGTSGCGPTCMAMVISTLSGKSVLPPVTAQFALDHGYRTADNGTAWEFFGQMAQEYGIACRQTANWEEVKKTLAQGQHMAMAIASMRPGHFTLGGHYIILCGIMLSNNDTWVHVLDPNMDNKRYGQDDLVEEGTRDDGKVTAKESIFRKEAGQFWLFTV